MTRLEEFAARVTREMLAAVEAERGQSVPVPELQARAVLSREVRAFVDELQGRCHPDWGCAIQLDHLVGPLPSPTPEAPRCETCGGNGLRYGDGNGGMYGYQVPCSRCNGTGHATEQGGER